MEDFLQGHSIESMLGALNELYSKYKYMETSFEKSKGVYKAKIPEIEQTLEIIGLMIKKKEDEEEMVTHYPLCDTLYAEAKVDTSESKICLWVGASTMVEYTYEEGEYLLTEFKALFNSNKYTMTYAAKELLETQVVQTQAKIEEINDDLAHLRTNSITVEVNMARLFNHNVKVKKLKEASA